jgi:hypothetical protein
MAISKSISGSGYSQEIMPLAGQIYDAVRPWVRAGVVDTEDVTEEALRVVGKHHHFSKHFAAVIGEALTENGYVIIRREP